MKSRRLGREAALQILYACETLNDWSEQNVELVFSVYFKNNSGDSCEMVPECRLFTERLVFGVGLELEQLDQKISEVSLNWSISRMLRVDRNILRMAVFEMLHCEDIPAKVSINEAIEIAKRFGSEESPTFINGVLDRIASKLSETKLAANS